MNVLFHETLLFDKKEAQFMQHGNIYNIYNIIQQVHSVTVVIFRNLQLQTCFTNQNSLVKYYML